MRPSDFARHFAFAALAFGCGDTSGSGGSGAAGAGSQGGAGGTIELPDPMGPLPLAAPGSSQRFVTSGACAQCHLAGEDGPLYDEDGKDMSPVKLWRSSMMALAARDPFYLAVFSQERHELDGAEFVESACSRCHAPASALEHWEDGSSFDELTSEKTELGNLARDGVTCSLCHQLLETSVGPPEAVSGAFQAGELRTIWGPHQSPDRDPMEFFIDYTPAYADHINKSELCASCHTVVTPVLSEDGTPTGETFLEQATFFEWENSTAGDAGSCGDCHLPRHNADGEPTASALATYPVGLQPRTPFGRHSFSGANAWVKNLIGDEIEWSGVGLTEEEMRISAALSEDHLKTAATVTILDAAPEGSELVCNIEVQNHAGHKLPTGYPTRRVWLHVTAKDAAGAVVFESGGYDARGSIVDAAGEPIASSSPEPHRDRITDSSEVLIYEMVPIDRDGGLAHRPLASATIGKDNRLLPDGWGNFYAWLDWIRPRGVDGDENFVGGSDRVEVRVPGGADVARVEVELLYQNISPEELDRLARVPTPAAVRFSNMAANRPPIPTVIASTEADL